MTAHAHKAERGQSESGSGSFPFNLLIRDDSAWWPYRSIAKSVLETQKNAHACLEVNRKLMDFMRDMFRKGQDLAFEMSEKTLEGMSETGWLPKSAAMPGASEVNAMFERATTGLQEISQAWMDAQAHSFDVMRSQTARASKSNGSRRHDSLAAAE